jgi:hypothetical protein
MVNSIENKYKKIYYAIISNRQKSKIPRNTYYESHHIIPKSLGGGDEKLNIINLTAREHYLCHYLLTKMFKANTLEYYKMLYAFHMMQCVGRKQKRYKSRLYELVRNKLSKAKSLEQSGKGNSQYGSKWVCNIETKKNLKLRPGENIPEGYFPGMNLWIKEEHQQKKYILKEQRNKEQESKIDEKIKFFSKLYDVYSNNGWSAVVESGYMYSQQNFVMMCSRYVPHFVPQNGKLRTLKHKTKE